MDAIEDKWRLDSDSLSCMETEARANHHSLGFLGVQEKTNLTWPIGGDKIDRACNSKNHSKKVGMLKKEVVLFVSMV